MLVVEMPCGQAASVRLQPLHCGLLPGQTSVLGATGRVSQLLEKLSVQFPRVNFLD